MRRLRVHFDLPFHVVAIHGHLRLGRTGPATDEYSRLRSLMARTDGDTVVHIERSWPHVLCLVSRRGAAAHTPDPPMANPGICATHSKERRKIQGNLAQHIDFVLYVLVSSYRNAEFAYQAGLLAFAFGQADRM